MTNKHAHLSERLKRLGFAPQNQMRLYGQEFEVQSDPIVMGDNVVFFDAIEKRSRESRRVRIPLNIVNMAGESSAA